MELEPLVRIAVSVAVGGAVGAEREYRDKAAGFRTLIFICVGACLFTIFSERIGISRDTARIAAQIVSGVGFLGGGAILREGTSVRGLTTAATIWLTAALGMGVGAGYYAITLPAAGLVLAVLWLFPLVEQWIDHLRVARTYEIVTSPEAVDDLRKLFREQGLEASNEKREKRGAEVHCSWFVNGAPDKHEALVNALHERASVKQMSF